MGGKRDGREREELNGGREGGAVGEGAENKMVRVEEEQKRNISGGVR